MLKRYWRLETGVFLSIWLILTVGGRAFHFGDPGSLWHIVVGERILSSGELIHTDPFSFTCAGQPWIAQWWLAECVMALLHRLGGLDTVLLAATTLLAALYTWIVHRLLRAGIHPLLSVLFTVMALAASSYHFHPRPHIVTIALVGWTFARLCDFEAGRIPLRGLFWLVPVFILWTNVHGGMVGGVGMVAVAAAGWCLAKLLGRSGPLVHYRQMMALGVLALACGLTPLVNPYGLAMPRVWFALMESPVVPRVMQEHMPLSYSPTEAAMVSLLGLTYLSALAGIPMKQLRVTWLLPLVWFGLAWTRVRHGPLFAVTAALVLGDMFPHVRWIAWLARKGSVTCRLRVPDPDAPHTGWNWRPALIPVVVVLTSLGLQSAAVPFPVLGHGWAKLDDKACPVELLPELQAAEQRSPKGTPIFNDMLFGGFLIYFTPDLRVFIDDRCELYGDQGLLEYADVMLNHPERINALAREYDFQEAIVIPGSRADEYLATAPGWSVMRRTDTAVLYRRGDNSTIKE